MSICRARFEFENPMSEKMYVQKRGGETEHVNFAKISARIKNLCHGLDMDHLDVNFLVMKVISGLYSGVTTKQIDDQSASKCSMMASSHPDYGILASRIYVSNLHKETDKKFSKVVEKLYKHIDSKTNQATPLVSDKFYSDVMANKSALDSAIIHDRDNNFSYFGLKTLENGRYLLSIDGKVVERPQHMFMRCAVAIHGRDVERILETYHAMSQQYFILASPFLLNCGSRSKGLTSCFLLASDQEGDSIDNMYKNLHEAAMIASSGGGIGWNIHDIRSKGAIIRSTGAPSDGIVKWLQVINASSNYVCQNATRRGSMAMYLEMTHPQLLEFMELKSNIGTEDKRARHLFYALWIPDLFMIKAKNQEDWCFFDPLEAPGLAAVYGDEYAALYEKYEREGRQRSKMPARKILELIIESQIRCGSPFICYKDAGNRKNNQKHYGTIRSSNLCTEIFEYSSNTETACCNLSSLCLPTFVTFGDDKKPIFDFQALYRMTKIVTRILDNAIDITPYPSEKAERSNKLHRPLGIGVSGLADVFSLMRVPFDSPQAKDLNRKIFETLSFAAYDASSDLAEERGPYSTYEGSEFSKGKFQWNLWEEESGMKVEHSGMWDWDVLREKMLRTKMRNSLLTALMPTATTSQICNVTEAFEPLNSNIYKRSTTAGEYFIINKHLLRDLCDLKLWNEEMKNELIKNDGSIQNITSIPTDIRELYKISWDIKMRHIIDMSADRGVYIDQSQSMNLFLPTPDYTTMSAMMYYAWDKKLKTGMYYLRQLPPNSPIKISLVNKTQKGGKADVKVPVLPTTSLGKIKEEDKVVIQELSEDSNILACSRDNPNCTSCSA